MSNEPPVKENESSRIKRELLAPFPESDLEWRVQSAGEKGGKTWCKVLVYVTNRAIMERLDDVLGIDGWQNKFEPLASGGNLCGISIKFDNEWVTKWDGADNTNMEAVKGGISGAMKRAGVQWGIGRYLYNVTVMWGKVSDTGKLRGQWIDKSKMKHYFKYDPPQLPAWALPEGSKNSPQKQQTPPALDTETFTGKMKWFENQLDDFKAILGREGFTEIGEVPVDKQAVIISVMTAEHKAKKD